MMGRKFMALKKMRIFAVGAHLDDIEIACGGTIAKAVDKGHAVKMIVLSKSAYVHYDGTIMRREEEAIKEAREAASILGVKHLEIFDFPNKDIPYESAVVELINSRLDEFKPNLIITHWPFDTHKSHQNTGLSTIAAGRYYNSILMFEPFPPGGRSYVGFRPQLYVNITKYIDKKLNALKAHKSEYYKYGKQNWINAVKARARFRGFDLISYENKDEVYAEAFEIVRLNIEFLD
jgi:LmbE family N-acetylglucosaminyl deacetylase